MMPLFDMMMNAQNGEAVRTMARQYGLSESQVEQAMAALMPAFSTGLKRNASNPADVGNFLQALAGGDHAKYFEDMQRAFTPQAMEEGNGVLGHLFGNKEVSRAVASQAAAATGIGQDILKQMLPVLANAIMGGLFKQSTGQFPTGGGNSGAGGSGNVIGDLIGEMMKNGMGMGGARQPSAPQAGPMDNPLGHILEGMFGGGAAASRQRPNAAPADPFDNPLGQIFKDMMGGSREAAPEPEPESQAAPRSRANPSDRPENPYDELFGRMFESGREVQQGYQKNVESIFDQFLQGMNRQR